MASRPDHPATSAVEADTDPARLVFGPDTEAPPAEDSERWNRPRELAATRRTTIGAVPGLLDR